MVYLLYFRTLITLTVEGQESGIHIANSPFLDYREEAGIDFNAYGVLQAFNTLPHPKGS